MHRKPKLGFCPIGKFVFSHEDALRFKSILEQKMCGWDVNFTGIDSVIPDGMVRSQNHVQPVVDYLKSQNIDALFIPHCNFGTEGAAGMIAHKLNVPTLLWGPRDEAPLADGTRLRDSLCGLFATSKVLHKLGTPFTYIENCRVDDPIFAEGFDTFMRTANVVRKARNMRIGQIGQRIDFFWTTIVNESELLEKFGVQIQPIDMVEFIRRIKKLADMHKDQYVKEIETSEAVFSGFPDRQSIINIYATRDAMLEVAKENNLDAFALQSFDSICDELGCMVEYSSAMVADAGIPVACETDIHGAISAIMLQAASYDKEPIIFADLTVRHPDNDNAILIWHCAFPESLKKPGMPTDIGTHWILPEVPSGSCHWELKEGPLSIFRFDGDRGIYESVSGEGRAVPGPATRNTYVWMEVNDWPTWEKTFIEGPYIHHVACCYGNYSGVLSEAAKYISGLQHKKLP